MKKPSFKKAAAMSISVATLAGVGVVGGAGTASAAALCPGSRIERMSVDTGWFDLYANGGYNCAVAIPRNPGVKLQMGVFIKVNGGTQVSDYGLYSQYAGPVTMYAKGTYVQFGGRIGMVGTESEWGHCG